MQQMVAVYWRLCNIAAKLPPCYSKNKSRSRLENLREIPSLTVRPHVALSLLRVLYLGSDNSYDPT